MRIFCNNNKGSYKNPYSKCAMSLNPLILRRQKVETKVKQPVAFRNLLFILLYGYLLIRMKVNFIQILLKRYQLHVFRIIR